MNLYVAYQAWNLSMYLQLKEPDQWDFAHIREALDRIEADLQADREQVPS